MINKVISVKMFYEKVFTINRRNSIVGLSYEDKNYVIGFKNPVIARNVMYNLPIKPYFSLKRYQKISIQNDLINNDIHDIDMVIDTRASLVICKSLF
jgi:hypothetical protein